jgi:uncharacterized protein (TIGR00725 family)
MTYRKKIRIGVIGGANPDTDSARTAYRVGHLIAEKEAILVCGGLTGVMESAARGCREAGGLSIGILPGESRDTANAFIDIPIATGMGYSRNALVVMNSDVLIAVDGKHGTLSEIAFSFVQNKPVFGLNTWDVEGVRPVQSPEEAVTRAVKHFFPLLT